MAENHLCRLCFSTSNDHYMNIFSVIGIEMKMSEIIGEHFKCEIRADDLLPNFVCHLCWKITEAFHELCGKSKTLQVKFLNRMIKSEVAGDTELHENLEEEPIAETQILVDNLKFEPHPDLGDAADSQDSCSEESDSSDEAAEEGEDEYEPVSNSSVKTNKASNRPKRIKQRKSLRKSNLTVELKKLFVENKYRFDLTCDNCSASFESLENAREHYLNKHNNPKGYLKCCNTRLEYPFKVYHHILKHVNPEKFKCHECGKVFKGAHGLSGHIKQQHQTEKMKKERFICDLCKRTFITKTALIRHIESHIENIESKAQDQYEKFMLENFDMSCDRCDVVFISLYDAQRHYKQYHDYEYGYLKCCKLKIRKHSVIKDHIRFHLEPECFKCDTCNKSFSTRTALVSHTREHKLTKEKPFTCDYCRQTWRSKFTLRQHMLRMHLKSSESKFECEICHRKFQLLDVLKQHKYNAHREKKTVGTCELCGKSFHSNCYLEKHKLQAHINEPDRLTHRKQCRFCGEWLKTRSGILYHQELHTTGPQQCPHCPKLLANRLAFLGHIRKYHRERNVKCGFCSKTFTTASLMREHEESHTRHKVYQCQYCPSTFTVSSSMRTHMRRNHPEQRKNSIKKDK